MQKKMNARQHSDKVDQTVQSLPVGAKPSDCSPMRCQGKWYQHCKGQQPQRDKWPFESIFQYCNDIKFMLESPERQQMNTGINECPQAQHAPKLSQFGPSQCLSQRRYTQRYQE